jgi:porin
MKPLIIGLNRFNTLIIIVCLVLIEFCSLTAQTKQESDTLSLTSGLGGPSSVPGIIRRDELVTTTIMKDYFDFKDRLSTSSGYTFGFDYTTALQTGISGNRNETAFSGIFRAFGGWALVGLESGNTGALIYQIYNGHRLVTDITPQLLGLELGYAGITATPFGVQEWALTNFYWSQTLLNGRLEFVAGLVDPGDYLNVYALIDPWTDFNDLTFSTGATIPLPAQGLGAAVYGLLSEKIYVLAGITDANGDPTDPLGIFKSFFSTAEYFSHIEMGWIESSEKSYTDNIHITFWHVSEKKAAGTPEGSGLAFSFCRTFADHWIPFLRGGFTNDGGALLEGSIVGGLGYYFPSSTDQLSVGFGWGKPSKSTFGENLRDQVTMELYYRLRLLKALSITPDIQFIINPALNPDKNFMTVFGIRLRASI